MATRVPWDEASEGFSAPPNGPKGLQIKDAQVGETSGGGTKITLTFRILKPKGLKGQTFNSLFSFNNGMALEQLRLICRAVLGKNLPKHAEKVCEKIKGKKLLAETFRRNTDQGGVFVDIRNPEKYDASATLEEPDDVDDDDLDDDDLDDDDLDTDDLDDDDGDDDDDLDPDELREELEEESLSELVERAEDEELDILTSKRFKRAKKARKKRMLIKALVEALAGDEDDDDLD